MTKLSNKVLFINNRRTSMRLCEREWIVLDNICKKENISRNKLIETIENSITCGLGLTYLTRLFVIVYYYELSSDNKTKPVSVNSIIDIIKSSSCNNV